ncbi:YihY/virulence factor BrkB family protein [Halobaculum limi]|uniref:YihY/virulence factor BrkB family protein n=1 Tax=Halobaculum limi TaxID=3031916 RepID=UPI002405086E|nr:YihY/virulence factor BrkB family protein [Halobaculum sp. YSMS11]
MPTDPDTTDADSALRQTVAAARRVANVISDRNVTFLAASVAYYAFISLFPAAVLALVVAVAVGGPQLAQAVIDASAGVLTETGQEVLVTALVDGPGQGSVTLISLPLTLWGALKVLRGLDIAFSVVYGTDDDTGIVDQLKDSLTVVTSITVSLVAMVAVGTVVTAVEVSIVARVVGLVALPALLTVAFLPMYYVFPDIDLTVREVVPGAVFAGVGWTLLQVAFQSYVEFQAARGGGQAALYGAIGAVLLLVTFLYFGAVLVLVGAVVNAVLGGHHGSEDGGVRTDGRGGGDGRGGDSDRERRPTDGRDRQGKGRDARAKGRMSGETEGTDAAASDEEDDGRPAPDIEELDERVAELRADLDAFDDRTVKKPALEAELKRYVRGRMRRGHARGWGPYLVLLYGTVMTLGAFYFLDGWVAIAAMLVLFLSTLGLYTLFVLVGVGLNVVEVPWKALDAVRDRR